MKLKLITFLVVSFVGFSQTKSLLENIKINDKTKLIGMYPQYDKSKTYKYLNFYINDKTVIESLVDKLTYDKIVDNKLERNDFRIIILQDNDEIESWTLSPMNSNIIVNGVYYNFNLEEVKTLAKKYSFEYTFFEKNFDNQKDYESFKSKMNNDKDFLFAYEPFFEHEGTFEITFPKKEEFKSPKMIDEFLRPEVNKIVGENNFNISYILDKRNMANQNEYIITIEGSKEIYKKLKLNNLKNSNWKNNQPSGMFFMKTK